MSSAKSKRSHYSELIEIIGWFFFDLLFLGYVEDFNTGLSFCFPKGLEWAVYIEVKHTLITPYYVRSCLSSRFLLAMGKT